MGYTLNASFMGFKNATDFTRTILGLWFWELLLVASVILGGIVAGFSMYNEFIDTFIFSPVNAVYTILVTLFADWLSAVYPAIRDKKFETNKAKRLLPTMFAHLILLGLVQNGGKYIIQLNGEGWVIAYEFFQNILIAYIFLVSFLSAVSNAGRNKLVNWKVVNFITKYVDSHKENIESKAIKKDEK